MQKGMKRMKREKQKIQNEFLILKLEPVSMFCTALLSEDDRQFPIDFSGRDSVRDAQRITPSIKTTSFTLFTGPRIIEH